MVHSGFRRVGHASTASSLKGAKNSTCYLIILTKFKKKMFSKHQNKAEFKNLDDSKVLSSDFPDLRTSAASMTSTSSTIFMASMTFTASFHQTHY